MSEVEMPATKLVTEDTDAGRVEERGVADTGETKKESILSQFAFPLIASFAQAVIIVCYFVFTQYGESAIASDSVLDVNNGSAPSSELDHYYPMFQDVHAPLTSILFYACIVMIFIGFGFLMTYLKKYGYSSVGLNFLVSAIVIQWSILSNAFWHQAFGLAPWHKVELVIETLITADFAAGAVLITFGAVLGKVTPAQLVLIAIIEVCVYGVNESIGAGLFGAVDMGGSIFVHTFGAYFGLACSLGLGLGFTRMNDTLAKLSKPTLFCSASKRDTITEEHDEASKENEPTKQSDMLAMIGTLFLWMFWPSFNGALATESQQHRVVINTLLSLCACCVSAFIFSALLRGVSHHIGGDTSHYKFDMVDIQNATLAGGVAVGSSADLVIEPWAALLIGCIAGFVSVAGYVFIGPFLHKAIGLHDTCGVHNLHGLPGLIGGVAGTISAITAGEEKYGASIATVFPERGNGRTAAQQGGYQMAALVVTVAIACTSGFLVGILIRADNWVCLPSVGGRLCCAQRTPFDDAEYWVVPEDENESHSETDASAHSDARSVEEGAPSCINVSIHVASSRGAE